MSDSAARPSSPAPGQPDATATGAAIAIGLILQRGGEELALTKVADRFTVRLTTPTALPALLETLQPESSQIVPTSDLIELVVAAEQLEAQLQRARSLPSVAFASHVYALVESPQTRVYLGDELTVQFADTATPAQIESLAAELGLARSQTLADWGNTVIFKVTAAALENPIKIANVLMSLPWVQVAEPNVTIQTQSWYRPQDALYSQQWYLQHQGGANLTPNSHISVEEAWDITRGVQSVVVAVIDDGFDLRHPDLQGIGKIVAPRDLRTETNLPLPEGVDENHGTAAAGVAIAAENGQGIVGVAPGCAFMPIRNTGFIDDRSIEQMFDWATTHGADVISCSWGVGAVYFPLSLRQRRAINQAATQGRAGKGCVIVFAAGNANRPLNETVVETGWPQEALKGSQRWMNGFAIHPDVIAVAACTSLGEKAVYSNWGKEISIAAPSNNAPPSTWLPATGSISTGPIVAKVLKGLGVLTTDRLGALGYDPNGFTADFGGTSSACPVVAGVAALVLSVHPDLTAVEVKQLLQRTADKIVDANPDPQLKLRKGSYSTQGHSDWFGYGKVNALKAVQAAQQLRPRPIATATEIQRFNDQAIAIPDDDLEGVRSAIVISDSGLLKSIAVSVDLRHDFLGDVELYLIPPQAPPILLQSRTLGRQTQLTATYVIATTPNLAQLLNTPVAGRWQLWLIDRSPTDTGQLNRWQLTLHV